jgi:heme-degrading monooxygenase HmoA
MLIHTVEFESALTFEDVVQVAKDRKPDYEAVPGLIQKYYVKTDKPNRYQGVMIWDTPASLQAFRETDLPATVGPSYAVVGTPEVRVSEVMFPLR